MQQIANPTYDVWTWPGWSAIGAWASVLGLITLLVAGWRLVVQRRQAPLFYLTWSVLGSANVDGKSYHVVEFTNAGRGFGYLDILSFVNGYVRLADEYRAPRVVASGQRFRILLTAPKLEDVWIRLMTRTPDDFTLMRFRWESLLSEGAMHEQWVKEREAWDRRSLLQRWWDRSTPRAVEPHGQLAARIRAGRSTGVVFGEKTMRIASSASSGAFSSGDLPYVGPPPKLS